MPITFDCPCGKTLRVGDDFAGRRVKCPACNLVGTVPAPEPPPAPEPQFEVVEDEPKPKVAARPVGKPTSKYDDDDDDDAPKTGYRMARTKSRDEDEDEEEEKPKKKPKKKKFRRGSSSGATENSGRSLEGQMIHGGVAGGILMMLIAVVWFVVGLANDWIFFYPPILFIIGLVAFIKGLTGEE